MRKNYKEAGESPRSQGGPQKVTHQEPQAPRASPDSWAAYTARGLGWSELSTARPRTETGTATEHRVWIRPVESGWDNLNKSTHITCVHASGAFKQHASPQKQGHSFLGKAPTTTSSADHRRAYKLFSPAAIQNSAHQTEIHKADWCYNSG